ncbi:MAG: hypothetical protein J2P37_26250, partial [Ktedonobacteraceae bacterium]|nr:hypothetical protein [Ktedonobacteraceae bacterium]
MSTIPVLADPLTDDYIESLLEQLNAQICEMARNKVPRAVIPPDVLDLEVDELAQRVRIKLWQALRSNRVHNLKAYLRCIVATECVDMVRRHKKTLPLLFSDDGEVYQGNIMIMEGQGSCDPAEEFESREHLNACVQQVAGDLQSLPTLQRKAVLWMLKERIADTLPLVR